MFTSLRRAGTRLSTRNIVTKPSEYGQPVFQSHPHLGMSFFSCSGGDDSLSFYWAVRRNDLTPGIPASDYEQRRRNLMESLPDRSIVISVAAPMKYMSASTFALLNCILRNAKFTLVLFRYLVSFLSAFDDETEESMSS